MTEDWFDFLTARLDAGVRFLVVGAHALTPDTVVQFGVPPNRIDILTGITGVPRFADAWADRLEQQVRGRTVPFLGREAFLTNKHASGRHKDLGGGEFSAARYARWSVINRRKASPSTDRARLLSVHARGPRTPLCARAENAPLRERPAHGGGIYCAAVTRDGETLAAEETATASR